MFISQTPMVHKLVWGQDVWECVTCGQRIPMNQADEILPSDPNNSGICPCLGFDYTETEDNPNYKLFASKYSTGLLEITGWVIPTGSSTAISFPNNFEFINNAYSAMATCILNVDDSDIHSASFISVNTTGFMIKCRKFDGTNLTDDTNTYSLSFKGRWKE